MERRILGAAVLGAALAAPGLAGAQSNGTQNYFTPPTLLKAAQPSVPVAGAGTVVVQVLVKADGSFTVQKVLHSTNHGDDDAALDVAKHSTYTPAKRGTKPTVAYYDYTLKFKTGGASSADAAPATGTALFERQLRAGNYSSAQSGLKEYVAQHPGDTKAQTDLGVADTYLGDYEAATVAFDKAGTIGDVYKAVAAKAYGDYANAEMNKKENEKALAAAKEAVALAPGFATYNTLGSVEYVAGDYEAAIVTLEKARSLGQTGSFKAADRAQINDNLLSAYLAAGKSDQAKTIFAETMQLDPNNTTAQNIMAASMAKTAQTAQDAGKTGDAAALFEQAATVAPAQAATLYSKAAFAYLSAKPNPVNDKAKIDADKALSANANDAGANLAEGIVLANTGKTKDAAVYLNKADAAAKQANNAAVSAAAQNALKQLNATK